jgi:hypothetical protein
MVVKNLAPELPTGVRVTEKPSDLEFIQRSKNKWVPIVNTLKIIDSTKCVEIDIAGANKARVNTIRQSIRKSASDMKFTHRIKFAIKDTTLYVWSNK